MPIPNPFYELIQSTLHPRQYNWLPGRLLYAAGYLAWQAQARLGPRESIPGSERLTVILLSHLRVRNLEPMVRSLLRCDFVEKILVSNNNPAYRIADWVRIRDGRVHLVDQPKPTPCSIRYRFALEEPGRYFLSIDDDVFLYPRQVRRLFEELVARPTAPHGFQGENFAGERTPRTFLGWKVNLHGFEGQVDNINTCYAFTREHAAEMDRLARLLGLDLSDIPMGSDVLLGAAGEERPFVHDIGRVLHCLSCHRIGVATWRKAGFFTRRGQLFRELRALKGWPVPPLSEEARPQDLQGAA